MTRPTPLRTASAVAAELAHLTGRPWSRWQVFRAIAHQADPLPAIRPLGRGRGLPLLADPQALAAWAKRQGGGR